MSKTNTKKGKAASEDIPLCNKENETIAPKRQITYEQRQQTTVE